MVFLSYFFLSPLGKENAHLEEKISTQGKASSGFDEAFSQLCDPLLPVRGHAMIQLALLLRQRDPKAVQATDTLLKIFLEQLLHDDSYIYLAAIQGLVSLADVRADMVIPRLACEFAMCQKEAGNVAVKTKDANEKGYYKQREEGWFVLVLNKACLTLKRVLFVSPKTGSDLELFLHVIKE